MDWALTANIAVVVGPALTGVIGVVAYMFRQQVKLIDKQFELHEQSFKLLMEQNNGTLIKQINGTYVKKEVLDAKLATVSFQVCQNGDSITKLQTDMRNMTGSIARRFSAGQ